MHSKSEDDTEDLTKKRRQETESGVFCDKRVNTAKEEENRDDEPYHSDNGVNQIENVDSFDGVHKILAVGVDVCVREDLGKNGFRALVTVGPS